MRPADVAGEALGALWYRRLRAALCALGIALGVACAVAILSIAATARAALLDQLGREGNLLTVASGRSLNNQPAPLPATAPAMLRRVPGVTAVAPVTALPTVTARRTAAIPPSDTNGLAVMTASPALATSLGLDVSSGRFLDAATGRFPAVVLGAGAARALGIDRVTPSTQVFLGTPDGPDGRYAAVLGILAPAPPAPEIDTAVLIGQTAGTAMAASDGAPTRVYLRAEPDRVPAVRDLLARTANPADPGAVTVGRPSDLLIARATAGGSLTTLAVGVGGIALLVGAIGVANVMITATLERRAEIGVRRALGATRAGIGALFLTEAVLLCVIAGLLGAVLGLAAGLTYATITAATPLLPPIPIAVGGAASLLAGIGAGLYPALRAARVAPTDALRSL